MSNPNFLGGEDAFAAAVRHRLIADDLERLATVGIDAVDLTSCSLLERWTVDFGPPSSFLRGTPVGDPLHCSGAVRTSGLVALDMEAGWARSWSRFYRLGTCGIAGAGR